MSQKVYILINESMPGYIKIGKSEQNLENRIKQLDKTGVPLPFEVFYAAEVVDMNKVETLLHETFADRRVRKNREFFEIPPEQAVSAIRLAEVKDITPTNDIVETQDDQRALDEARKKRENFNFNMVDVPKGSILKFTQNEEDTCLVSNNKKVIYDGEEMSLSKSASLALGKLGKFRKAVQGPSYRTFDGETLKERRMRYEEGDE